MISLIVAASTNNVIGKDNQLLWHLPNDLRFFKNTTWGSVVIMGRKTFESVNKPLPGRLNIVITRQSDWQQNGVIKVGSLSDAIRYAEQENFREIFIVGGGEIYRESMSLADRIYMTRVHTVLEGDTFFPEISANDWIKKSEQHFDGDEKNKWAHTIEIWERKECILDTGHLMLDT